MITRARFLLPRLRVVGMQTEENATTSGQCSDIAKVLRKKLSSLKDVGKASYRR